MVPVGRVPDCTVSTPRSEIFTQSEGCVIFEYRQVWHGRIHSNFEPKGRFNINASGTIALGDPHIPTLV